MDRMRRSGNSNSNQQTENLLESQNNQEVEHLRGKISQLKDVTVIINDTINSHNAMLDDMGNSFSDTNSLMGISMRRVAALTNASGGKLMWYIVLFAVFVFFMIYFLSKR
eukprot:m.22111 g.22111  ORF g.22111 m.22111 type:complete len:110 (+) comp8803_c0_seq2:25-354(+)